MSLLNELIFVLMFQIDREERATAAACLKHPWFSDVVIDDETNGEARVAVASRHHDR